MESEIIRSSGHKNTISKKTRFEKLWQKSFWSQVFLSSTDCWQFVRKNRERKITGIPKRF